jgi:transcriptional regulator with GAF, ATPase, and Fis domain
VIGRGQAAALITAAPMLVRRAGTADEALAHLVGALRVAIPTVVRLTVRRHLADEEQLEIVAVWSARETRLQAGVRMSSVATSFPEVIQRDGPVIRSPASAGPRMIKELLASEGDQSWVAMPLRGGDDIVGLLTISSSEPDAFDPADLDLFAKLGRSVQARLIELMSP